MWVLARVRMKAGGDKSGPARVAEQRLGLSVSVWCTLRSGHLRQHTNLESTDRETVCVAWCTHTGGALMPAPSAPPSTPRGSGVTWDFCKVQQHLKDKYA